MSYIIKIAFLLLVHVMIITESASHYSAVTQGK
jgi:hypothetical protein